MNRTYNVLFLCTGNSARSIMAEALLNREGAGRFRAFSAGSFPKGQVHPMSLNLLRSLGFETDGLHSKSWDEFAAPGAPQIDFIFTVCADAAGETCPIWPGHPMTAHWGIEDPARVEGEGQLQAFQTALSYLKRRIELFLALPMESIDRLALQNKLREIGAGPVRRPQPKKKPDVATLTNTAPARPGMTTFERYLSIWVALCIVAGIALGAAAPGLFELIASAEVARVNLPVALLVWLMIIPMLLKIDFGALGQVRQHLRGVGVTLFINWAVKPFSMALLGTVFVGWLFRPLLPADQIESYIAGLILLAAAPCTAMVFVWSNLCDGEPHYTLSQVALNDLIMVFAFAPLVGLLLGVASITVPWETLLISVVLYIVVPVIIAQVIRHQVMRASGQAALDGLLRRLGPVSLVALLSTLVLLFGFQGEAILEQPLVIALLAVPILIQVYFNAGLAYWLSRKFGVAWCVAAPAALIGASNFFELAVAAAISLFGLQSGAALATVVGVLVEVPVMLSVVWIVKRSRGWYEEANAQNAG